MSSKKQKPESGYEGHGDSSNAPSPKKGKFTAIGTYMDAGTMTTTSPKSISVNVKSGTLGSGASD